MDKNIPFSNINNRLWYIQEFSSLISVSALFIYRLIGANKLPYSCLGKKLYRFKYTDILSFLRQAYITKDRSTLPDLDIPLLTLKEALAYMNLSRPLLDRLRQEGKISYFQIGDIGTLPLLQKAVWISFLRLS